MNNILNSEVETPEGKATLKEIYVTELGYIMMKIHYPSKGVFINYNVANVKNLLESIDISLLSGFEERITLEEKLID